MIVGVIATSGDCFAFFGRCETCFCFFRGGFWSLLLDTSSETTCSSLTSIKGLVSESGVLAEVSVVMVAMRAAPSVAAVVVVMVGGVGSVIAMLLISLLDESLSASSSLFLVHEVSIVKVVWVPPEYGC
ncbi:unnamed protein product [Camellia sinensis]